MKQEITKKCGGGTWRLFMTIYKVETNNKSTNQLTYART